MASRETYKFLPEDLLKDPSLLLHSKPPENHDYAASDGLVGCLLPSGVDVSFITSPNFHQIYQPQLGANRTIHMRVNLRYGADDPLQWPQPFTLKSGHHMAIRRQVKDQGDPLSLAWWLPEKTHFIPDSNSLFGGLGRLDSNMFRPLRELCEALLVRISKSEEKNVSSSIPPLSTLLSDYLHRLEHLSTDFDTLLLLVRGLQRIYLELLAIIDYHEIYLPRMNGVIPHSKKMVAPVMGCFTNNLHHAENIQRAGIPVWLIRPSEQVINARIRTLVVMRCPEKHLPLEPHKRSRWIFRGSNSDYHKNDAIFLELSRVLDYPNLFASMTAPDQDLPLPEPPQPKKISFKPYPKGKKKKPTQTLPNNYSSPTNPGGRDKFSEPNCLYFPPAIDAWRTALSTVDRPSNSNLKGVWGYVLPEPAGLVAIQDLVRQRSMFQFWLKFRSALLYQATSGRTGATPNSATFWRKLLSQEYEKGAPQQASSGTKTSVLRDCVLDYLAQCVKNVNLTCTDSSQLQLLSTDTVSSMWLGVPFPALDETHFEQILWELTELNFRFELMSLDSWLAEREPEQQLSSTTPVSTHDRQSLVEACFWGVRRGSLFVFDIGSANKGLADHDWRKRSKYLLALKALMKSWRGDKPASLTTPERLRWAEEDVLQLERDLTKFYTQAFFNSAHRAPITPRRLSHPIPPNPDQTNAPPTTNVVFLNPNPKYYYDLSTLKLDDVI